MFVYVAGALVIAVLVMLIVANLLDRHWYKRHPGAEKKFATIDDELTSKGL